MPVPEDSLVDAHGILELHLSPRQFWCLEQAAGLVGEAVADFCVSSAINRAEYFLANRSRLALTEADGAALEASLGGPVRAPCPGEALGLGEGYTSIHPLGPEEDLATFDCGFQPLDHWLIRHALGSQMMGHSETFVVTVEGRTIGYYALALEKVLFPDSKAHALEDQKVMLLLRLAVDHQHQGRGVATALVRDAIKRSARSREERGVQLLLVDAQDTGAQQLYLRCGFVSLPSSPSLLFVDLISASVTTTSVGDARAIGPLAQLT